MKFKTQKKHAVMMEYVIIAVLIAAAVVVAVIMFGKNVSKEMNVATQSMSDAKGAETAQKEVKTGTQDDIKKANEHEKNMHNYQ
jgi:Flp pilus assembly pilin Flp